MTDHPNLIGLEFVVSGIDVALAYFVDVLRLPLVWRGPSRDAPGETAVIDAGTIAITLFAPTASAAGAIAHRDERLSRIVLDTSGCVDVVARSESAGLPIRPLGDGSCFVPPEAMEGVLGLDVALVFTQVEGDIVPTSTAP